MPEPTVIVRMKEIAQHWSVVQLSLPHGQVFLRTP
ncbi:hypothetical protein O987_21190 [Comamonas testosteroni TK102]|jgi:hypothetical protein|uniref:Uncharacterized protein n=2 Tax=Comamonas testosteroni TaxID=285 RepID=B7WYF1_COMTK|nr:hypothetical protein O987_21190 [Comamonas testosteroni TK102]EED66084.1 hypothetical protein CtesDRAFT_PD1030 [Comamonas testosteroni KF-1]